MTWSAAQYVLFEAERTRPVRDLLAQVPETRAMHVADLGCGPGNSTELLRQRFPGAGVTGIDSSGDMIEAARARLPDVRFELGDISAWESGETRFDVILANASLHWVPDHAGLLPKLAARLRPGGSLAVQMPDNLDQPAHRLMREVAAAGPWAARLADARRAMDNLQAPSWYDRVLRACGLNAAIWRTEYFQPLAGGPSDIVAWFRSTGLRPYLAPLDPAEKADFLARYEAALMREYPAIRDDGTVMLGSPRLFFVATAASGPA